MHAAGQRLGQASDTFFSIYERKAKAANDIRVQDANDQYINGVREILRTGPDAYYKQSGADAINGAGATIKIHLENVLCCGRKTAGSTTMILIE
ncbi:hypothetical protein BH10PSE6_BH10PSE6_42110 [soil metagenome]